MAKKRSKNTRPVKVVEWIGGVVTVPTFITDEAALYRPEMLGWLGPPNLSLLGSAMGRPGELIAQASAHLNETLKSPSVKRQNYPTRIRVADKALADALRISHPDLDVVCAPTPEMDRVTETLVDFLDATEGEPSYLVMGVTEDMVASMFRATAALFRAAPWTVIPTDATLINLTVEALDVHDRVICVIGQMSESHSVILFEDEEGFAAYLEASFAFEEREDLSTSPSLPSHIILNFERGADVVPSLRLEIMQYGWEVAAAEAHPWVVVLEDGPVARGLNPDEMILVEAMCRGLSLFVAEPEEVLSPVWDPDETVERTYTVSTYRGDMAVTFCTYGEDDDDEDEDEDEDEEFEFATLALEALEALEFENEVLDGAVRAPFEMVLLDQFDAIDKAGRVSDDTLPCRTVMDFAASHLDVTIATLGPEGLADILFDVIPNRVLLAPEEGLIFLSAIRSFYVLLTRAGLPQGLDCLDILGEDADERFKECLANEQLFGGTKRMLISGKAVGFDMGSSDGIAGYLSALED